MSLLLLDEIVALFPPERGRLHIDGTTFRTETGALWQWRGFSWFLGFLRYCRGEDVTPDLRWMRAHGFNIPRVFGPLPWTETPDYRIETFRFDRLPAFFALLERHGLRCNFSIGHYRHPGLAAFAQRFYDIADRHWNVLAERVNEPHVGPKPDPILDFDGVDNRGVLTSYGLYGRYYDKTEGLDPVLDFGTIHVSRDSAWHRKARHAEEIQHATGKPWISDEPAKITEPGFEYVGGKNDPSTTPAEAVWHAAVCALWTPGHTVHTEEGKWGHVPRPGQLQHTVVEAVRDHVFQKIDASWQVGEYNGSDSHDSPVDDVDEPDGDPIWTYTSLHTNRALSVRCALSAPRPRNGWRVTAQWGPGNSIVQLER